MTLVPIASLSPNLSPRSGTTIRAIITLLWPYSSSTQQCALLLADPDFRLRNHHGQIRVRFTGPSGKAVAQSRVHIGDEVILTLEGSMWAQNLEMTRTPGRSVDGELVYSKRLLLRITRPNEEDITLDIDAASPHRSPDLMSQRSMIQTPAPKNAALLRVSPGDKEGVYESPAFAKRLRLSGSYLVDPPYGLFMNEMSDTDHVRKKARRSWAGITHWQYRADLPSLSTPILELGLRSDLKSDQEFQARSLYPKISADTAQSILPQVDGSDEDRYLLPENEHLLASSDASLPPSSRNQQESEDVLPDILRPRDDELTYPSSASQTKSQVSSRTISSPSQDHSQSRGLDLHQAVPNRAKRAEETNERLGIAARRRRGLQPKLTQAEIEFSLPRSFLQDSHRDGEHIESSIKEQSIAQSSAEVSDHVREFRRDTGVDASSEEVYSSLEAQRREDIDLSLLPFEMEKSGLKSLDQALDGNQCFRSNRHPISHNDDFRNVIPGCDEREDIMIHSEEAGAPGSSANRPDENQQNSTHKEWAEEVASPQPAAHSYHRSVSPPGRRLVTCSPPIKTPVRNRVYPSSPHSEKQQIMAQTFKSLFGFRSPERQVADTVSRESLESELVDFRTATATSQTLLEDTCSPSKSFSPKLLLDNTPTDITIQPSPPPSANSSSLSSGSLLPTSNVRSTSKQSEPEPAYENMAPVPRGPSPAHRSPSIHLAEMYVSDGSAELAYSSLAPVESPTPLTNAEVIMQVEPAAPVSSPPSSHTHVERDIADSFVTRTNIPATSVEFSMSQEHALRRLFGYSSAQEPDFQSTFAEGTVISTVSRKKLNTEDHGFLDDIINVHDVRHPAETAFPGADDVEMRNSERIVVDLQRKHDEDAAVDVVPSLPYSLDTAPGADGSRDLGETQDFDGTIIEDSQGVEASQFIEQSSTSHRGDDINNGEQNRYEQNASTEDKTGTGFRRTVSLSPQPTGHYIMSDSETHLTTGVLKASEPHQHIVGHEDGDQDRAHQGISHTANAGDLLASKPRVAATDTQSHEAEALATLSRNASPAMSLESQLVGRHGHSRTPSSSVSHSTVLEHDGLPCLDERMVSQQRDRASSSTVIATSQEFDTELAQRQSATGWHPPEIADSQSPGEVIKEAPASLTESHTQSVPSEYGKGKRASVHNAIEEKFLNVHSNVKLSLDEGGDSAIPHYTEFSATERTEFPESTRWTSSLYSAKDDETTTTVEPGALLTGTILSSDFVDELGEALGSSSVASEFDDPVRSERVNGDSTGNGTTDPAASEGLTVEQSLQSAANTSVLYGADRQTVEPNLLAGRHAAPVFQDVLSRTQGTHDQSSLAASASGQMLPLTPLDSQLDVDNSEQAQVTSVHTDSNNIIPPPTPQLTQSISELLSAEGEIGNSDVLSHKQVDSYLQTSHMTEMQAERTDDGVAKAVSRQVSARKSLGKRLSYVPEVISAWFSPRRVRSDSSSVATETQPKEDEIFHAQNQGFASVSLSHGMPSYEESQDFLTSGKANGITTSFGYYHSLASIERLLNPSSQQAFGSNHIDILALVTGKTSLAERAKSGPRDFFTVFKVHDLSISDAEDVRVEVFRPWRAKLPEADVGDVVLLRSFVVKSRKRESYLLSTDTSAWCVWRYTAVGADDRGREDKPVWARRVSDGADGMVREETKGPQLEFGDEERQYVRALRATWLHTSGMRTRQKSET